MLCYRQSTIFSTDNLQSEKCHHNFQYPWNFPSIMSWPNRCSLASITSLAKSIKGSGLQRSNTYLIPKGLLPHPNLCLSTGKMMVFFRYANDISRARINEKLAFFYRRVLSYYYQSSIRVELIMRPGDLSYFLGGKSHAHTSVHCLLDKEPLRPSLKTVRATSRLAQLTKRLNRSEASQVQCALPIY